MFPHNIPPIRKTCRWQVEGKIVHFPFGGIVDALELLVEKIAVGSANEKFVSAESFYDPVLAHIK